MPIPVESIHLVDVEGPATSPKLVFEYRFLLVLQSRDVLYDSFINGFVPPEFDLFLNVLYIYIGAIDIHVNTASYFWNYTSCDGGLK